MILRQRLQGRIGLGDETPKGKFLDQSAIDWICGSGLSNWLEQQLGNDKEQWNLEMQKKQKLEVNENWRNSLLETLQKLKQQKKRAQVRKKRVQRSRHQCE